MLSEEDLTAAEAACRQTAAAFRPPVVLTLIAEVRRLRRAIETAVGNPDDGGLSCVEHGRDLAYARNEIQSALEVLRAELSDGASS